MKRKRIQRPTTYDKTIKNLCMLNNCTSKEARHIYNRRITLKLKPE